MNESEIIKIVSIVAALAVAIIGHEIMHGWVAYRYGDNTAKSQGRLSINPIVHIDLVGTILLPAILYISGSPFLFGWAKPVPVDINTVIRNGGTGAAVAVSLAGITYNFALAAIFATIFPTLLHPDSIWGLFLAYFIYQSVVINVLLGVFNLWPIPPLDGANAVRYISQGWGLYRFVEFYDKIYPYGMFILMGILFTPISSYLFQPVGWIVKWLLY
ncbi:FIG004556: membrane metalloprotease [hydrothermal vent metagenome]|uniref:FIG004556: membrane metalloprotease n=1 Tax=hydrothermal vent metagenome TaxID=652676 RepID=A0A1W1C308_9ZZZZ